MNGIIWRFINICRFRAGPQDVPASGFLLGMILIAYLLIGVLLQQQELPIEKSVVLVCFDILLMAGYAYFLLSLRSFTNRFLQVFTALIGCGVILELIAWPLVLWQQQIIGMEDKSMAILIPSIMLWAWLFWNIGVIAHILRHALVISFQIATGLSLFYVIISFSLIRILMAA